MTLFALRLTPRERKSIRIISVLFLFIIVLTFLETYLQGVELSSQFVTNNIIVFVVVNINIILLMVLMLLIGRNFIKLYFEHRQKILGSRFKTKLIVVFISLSIIPSLVLFIVSLVFVNKSIRNWFDIKVEEVLKGTADISRAYYQSIGENNLHYARRLSAGIATGRLLNAQNPEALIAYISGKQREYRLSTVQVFDTQLREFVAVSDPGTSPDRTGGIIEKSLVSALHGEEATLIDSQGKGDVIRTLVPIASPRAPKEAKGVLMVSTPVPANLGRQVRTITSTYESYRQSKILKNPIRFSYQVTLSMIFLLIIFFATWFAFYLARFITTPIQLMAEGTRRISGGDLDFRINLESDDELGMLIDSFNRMTADLKANKLKLESAYRRLEKGNLELEGRKRYIETVLDSIATGVISLDREGRLTTVNKAAQSMLGLASVEDRELPWKELLQDSSYAEIAAAVGELFSRSVDRLERKIDVLHEGTSLNLLLIGSNLYDERMAYAGTVVVLENLTEVINAQRIAAWREVARRIAHEIKNPLTPIKLSAQRLRKKFFQRSNDFDGVFDDGTQMIIEQVDELKKLVDEFSRFARMPASHPVPTDIHAVLNNTLKIYRETYKDMVFVTDFHPGPLLALVDAEQMKRAMVNLIDNAIDATDGRGTVTVETAYDKVSQSIRISFKDDGRGIPPEVRDKLFIPYFSTKKEGTGLGLTIVSSIISDHHGYIRVKANQPRGTVLIIELPALKGNTISV